LVGRRIATDRRVGVAASVEWPDEIAASGLMLAASLNVRRVAHPVSSVTFLTRAARQGDRGRYRRHDSEMLLISLGSGRRRVVDGLPPSMSTFTKGAKAKVEIGAGGYGERPYRFFRAYLVNTPPWIKAASFDV